MKLSQFLLNQFASLGVDTVFGVPGDYNLRLLDYIDDHENLNWVGNCNELNAAYATDGYARIKGMGLLVTTYGVGELSAMNGVAGAYAENVPLVHLIGMPATGAQLAGLPVHHSLANGRFDDFLSMWQHITCVATQLSHDNWLTELEHVISSALKTSKPACMAVPADLFDLDVPDNIELHFSTSPNGSEDPIDDVVALIVNTLAASESPVAWLGCNTRQFQAVELTGELMAYLNTPFAQTLMSKSLYDESSPHYLGLYVGDSSPGSAKDAFESADCLLQIGVRVTDFNSGGFTQKPFDNHIVITDNSVSVNEKTFIGINTHKLMKALLDTCRSRQWNWTRTSRVAAGKAPAAQPGVWSADQFWDRMVAHFEDGDILLADAGTSFFCMWERQVAIRHRLLTQVLWSSIGYTLPAALGASCAAPDARTMVFIGDGALQMTIQEISTIARQRCPVTVFVLNNQGYSAERFIHGMDRAYNDIVNWDYPKVASAFHSDIGTHYVDSMETLETALTTIAENAAVTPVNIVEARFDASDVPKMLKDAVEAIKSQNS
ncbi:MAG: thiamine pyrophosphate-binding protein [Pseudomonadota bacterium]